MEGVHLPAGQNLSHRRNLILLGAKEREFIGKRIPTITGSSRVDPGAGEHRGLPQLRKLPPA
eukprot:15151773-Heterocapsa_arctica.AAC.1